MIFVVIVVSLLVYAALIFFYFYHWRQTNDFSGTTPASATISVIVAARNEEKNIARLLKSLSEQTYPQELFEVIVVDDFSTDETAETVKLFLTHRIHLIQPEIEPVKSFEIVHQPCEAGLIPKTRIT